MKSELKAPRGWVIALALGIPVALYVAMSIVPILIGIYNSMFKDISGEFLGLSNYARVMKDKSFWNSFGNTLTITVIALVGQVGFGFLISLLLAGSLLRMKKFHRTVIFFPVMLSTVIIGLLWMMIYNSQAGLLNEFLRWIAKPEWIQKWLDDPKIVLYAVSAPMVWQFIGLYMVILMSNLESIPKEVLESAQIDGANGVKQAWYITIPMTYDTLKVAVTLCIAGTLKIFDHIFVMTGGGPGNTSSVMSLYAYKISFVRMNMSYGNAIAICVLMLSLLIVVATRKLMGGKRYE